MDNYVEELKIQIEKLYQRIDESRDMLIAYNLIEKGKGEYQQLFLLPSIINTCMQLGNYKRAAKYYFYTNRLMCDVETNNEAIKKTITRYILKE